MYLKGFCFILLFTIAVGTGGKPGGNTENKHSKAPSSSKIWVPIAKKANVGKPANPSLVRFQVVKHGSRVEGDKRVKGDEEVLEEDQCFCSAIVINAAARIALTSKICVGALQWKKHYKSEFNAVSAAGDTFSVVGYVEFEKEPMTSSSKKKNNKKSQAGSSVSGHHEYVVGDLAFVILGEARNQIPLPNEPDLQVKKAFLWQWNYDQNQSTWKAIEHEIDAHTVQDSWDRPAFRVYESDYVGDEPPASFCHFGSPVYMSTSVGTRLSGIHVDAYMIFVNVRKFSAQIESKMEKIVSGEEKIIPL